MSRLVEGTDDFERPQSAPPLFADGISGGFSLVRSKLRSGHPAAVRCRHLQVCMPEAQVFCAYPFKQPAATSVLLTEIAILCTLQHQNGNGLAGFASSGLSAADTYTDIRYDDDYEKFYQSAAGASGLKLPPPLEQRTLYHELPRFSQTQGGDGAVGLRPPSALGLSGGYNGESCCCLTWSKQSERLARHLGHACNGAFAI